jgi:2-octaprenyl-6-methoxyphenol hydroxylase
VWVESRAETERLASLDEADFRRALETVLQGLLGSIGAIGPRARFPLAGLTAEAFARNRVALAGEAAHAIPPIGAQGLNLGLRDAAHLADCAADALREGRDIGGAETLADFDSARRFDVASRIATVDLLNRSLLSSLLPVHLARGHGLYVLKAVPSLRRLVVREGLQPSQASPCLMQPDGEIRLKQRAGRADVAA